MAVPMSRAKGNLHSIQEIVDVYWLKGQLREELLLSCLYTGYPTPA